MPRRGNHNIIDNMSKTLSCVGDFVGKLELNYGRVRIELA